MLQFPPPRVCNDAMIWRCSQVLLGVVVNILLISSEQTYFLCLVTVDITADGVNQHQMAHLAEHRCPATGIQAKYCCGG